MRVGSYAQFRGWVFALGPLPRLTPWATLFRSHCELCRAFHAMIEYAYSYIKSGPDPDQGEPWQTQKLLYQWRA